MASTAEQQQQLDRLRAAHEQEVAELRARITKLESELSQMQGDTEMLEKEEEALERQFGNSAGRGESEGPSTVGTYLRNVLKGVLDGDESKCRMR